MSKILASQGKYNKISDFSASYISRLTKDNKDDYKNLQAFSSMQSTESKEVLFLFFHRSSKVEKLRHKKATSLFQKVFTLPELSNFPFVNNRPFSFSFSKSKLNKRKPHLNALF